MSAATGQDSGLHVITVTRVPDEHSDDVEFTVDHCPGDTCSVWWECTTPCAGHQPTEAETEDGWHENHGVRHQLIEGRWMTESQTCALTGTDSGNDGASSAAEKAGLGTHRLSIDYWGDGIWDVELVSPETEKEHHED